MNIKESRKRKKTEFFRVDEHRVIQIDIYSRVAIGSPDLVGVCKESYQELFELLEEVVENYSKDSKSKQSDYFFLRGLKIEASYKFVRRTAIQTFCYLSSFTSLSYCKDKLVVQVRPLTTEREDLIDFSNFFKRPRTITGYFSNPATASTNLKSLSKKNKKKNIPSTKRTEENPALKLKIPALKKLQGDKPNNPSEKKKIVVISDSEDEDIFVKPKKLKNAQN